MYANPKETTSLRLDATMKRRSRELLALHGMTLTEAFEEYMDELVYRGGPPMRASREAKANTMRIRFEAYGRTAVTSVKIPEDVAGETESVLKGLGTNFSQAVRLLALQTTALGGVPFAASIPRKAR